MASELVPDLLNGLVAAGTLALAGATVSLGSSARRGAVDAASHRVVVSRLEVAGVKSRSTIPGGVGQTITEARPWDMIQHNNTKIGLVGRAHLWNEGTATGLLRLEAPDAEVEYDLPELYKQENCYIVPTDSSSILHMTWWQTAESWRDIWLRRVKDPSSPEPPPNVVLRLRVRGATGEVHDSCELSFGAYPLQPHATNDSWFVTPPSLQPGCIGLMHRKYHGRRRRTAQWAN